MENPFEQLGERLATIEAFLLRIDTKLSTPLTPPPLDRYIDVKELTELFKVSSVTVWSWEKKGFLQGYRIGRLRKFKLNEVLASPKAIERGILPNSKNSTVIVSNKINTRRNG